MKENGVLCYKRRFIETHRKKCIFRSTKNSSPWFTRILFSIKWCLCIQIKNVLNYLAVTERKWRSLL